MAGRFCRTGDQAVRTDANFFERMTQVVRTNANFFQTGSKRNSVRKRKAVIARFRVKGHIWLQLEIRLKGVDLGFSMALSVE